MTVDIAMLSEARLNRAEANYAMVEWREAEAEAAKARGEPMFMSKPHAWFDDPHWFCINGHVSGVFLKCETGGDQCLACQESVILGPPISEREFGPIAANFRALLLKDIRDAG